jgi:hypothetical protein
MYLKLASDASKLKNYDPFYSVNDYESCYGKVIAIELNWPLNPVRVLAARGLGGFKPRTCTRERD